MNVNITRRQLFTNWFDTFYETIEEGLKKISVLNSSKTKKEEAKWFKVGFLKDFLPNTINCVEINNISYIIVSNDIGIFCLREDLYKKGKTEPRYLIRLENGEVMLNPFEFAPKESIFSIILNEFINEKEV